MKYKVYQVAENKSPQAISLSANLRLIIFLNQLLEPEENHSLTKLLHAAGFTSDPEVYVYNKSNPNWFLHNIEFSSFNLLEQIWVFGLQPVDLGFPVNTPLGRGFICLGKVWMFFPSYPSIIKNEKAKRDLWNAIKNSKALV